MHNLKQLSTILALSTTAIHKFVRILLMTEQHLYFLMATPYNSWGDTDKQHTNRINK